MIMNVEGSATKTPIIATIASTESAIAFAEVWKICCLGLSPGLRIMCIILSSFESELIKRK